MEPQPVIQLTRTHRILIGVVVIGAVIIAGIGFAGSYAAVRALAVQKGFGGFSLVFPIGIDAGICVLLALDLLLTWMRIPFPLLRQTAWLLTAATIAFNGAAAWPDPLGVGMHAVIPILFVVTVEAARHAVGRIADITADRHMEGVRITRWLLSPVPTFKLWRRMKLWELRSYDQAVTMEQDRLIYQARLQARYGRAWRRKAPVEALMPLRLARIGVPLSQTAATGLVAAGLEPVLVREPAAVPRHELTIERADVSPEHAVGTGALIDGPQPAPAGAVQTIEGIQALSPEDMFEAYRSFAAATGVLPDAGAFAQHLADAYGVRDSATGEPLPAAEVELLLAPAESAVTDDRQARDRVAEAVADASVANFASGGRPADGSATAAAPDGRVADGTSTDFGVGGRPAYGQAIDAVADGGEVPPVADRPSATPHPFFTPRASLTESASEPETEAATDTPSATPAAPANPAVSAGAAERLPRQISRPAPDPLQDQLWEATSTDSGATAARLPAEQVEDEELTEADRQIQLVVTWLTEAEAAGEKLAGAEVGRRLGVPTRTGLRRLKSAAQQLEEHRRQAGRAHLRSVSTNA
ncbi:DUF2637 domain-containing protein [Streptomyces sp. NPDC006512]|uniref:DUF2637 domain-containing protein n=1 Tax=Streptomyces sp. NPDC006512 TaxID=3154307 RepID=UPI0033A3EBF0